MSDDINDRLMSHLDAAYESLAQLNPSSDEYTATVKNIQVLESVLNANTKTMSDSWANQVTAQAKLDESEKKPRLMYDRPWWIPSPDSLIGAVASLGGILCILNYEQLHPVATKAIGFVVKARV